MKKLLIATVSTLLLSNLTIAQTKLIAHKSHSGKATTFKSSLNSNIFGAKNSNFGQAPERFITSAVLDSVIFVSKQKAIMITSSCWKNRIENSNAWIPGREEVYNHPLFSHQHSLDSIKAVLKTQYYFDNNIDDVVFIGYDNLKVISSQETQKNSFPIVQINNKPPFGWPGLLLIVAFGLIAVLLFAYKLPNKKSLLQS